MITLTYQFTAESLLFYLCVLATIGVLLKVYQLFGQPNKR